MLTTLLRPSAVIEDDDDVRTAACLLAAGVAVAHGFANFYGITARGDAATVRHVNVLKGRPVGQVGSVTLPSDRVATAFDLDALPDCLPVRLMADVVEELVRLGPIGFRGPAAGHLPDHLTGRAYTGAGPVRTTQVIVPGRTCPANRFLEASAAAVGHTPLFITSANRSRHLTGAEDEPAHWRGADLRHELAGMPDLVVLEHRDEAAARARFPLHLPMSVTVLGLHAAQVVGGRVSLPVERHGSLAVDHVRAVLAPLGVGVLPGVPPRLRPRTYAPQLI